MSPVLSPRIVALPVFGRIAAGFTSSSGLGDADWRAVAELLRMPIAIWRSTRLWGRRTPSHRRASAGR
jgi:hypothetical protein